MSIDHAVATVNAYSVTVSDITTNNPNELDKLTQACNQLEAACLDLEEEIDSGND